jgi:hypothetical protein
MAQEVPDLVAPEVRLIQQWVERPGQPDSFA